MTRAVAPENTDPAGGFCSRCGGFVADAGGYCLLGHRLTSFYISRARHAGRRAVPALKGAGLAMVLYVGVVALAVATQTLRDRTVDSDLARMSTVSVEEMARRDDDGVRPMQPRIIGIPRLGLVAKVTKLGIEPSGRLEVPSNADDVGWFSGGARPGEEGPAVLVGHVDSMTGSAVFVDLHLLRVGDVVAVQDSRGHARTFEVTRIRQVPKSRFPTSTVYGETRGSTLRLITCAGRFDPKVGHYSDNLVVFARAVGPCIGDHLCRIDRRSSDQTG